MEWETPSFIEIDMSAEIGAYQSDFGEDYRRDEEAPPSPDVERASALARTVGPAPAAP